MKKRNIAQRVGFDWARSQLITEAGVLAKRANQRIHEIVSQGAAVQGASNAYQYLRTKIYDKEQGANIPWLTTVERKNKKTGEIQTDIKFETNFRYLSTREIQFRLKKIKEFLEAKTSKVKGVKSRIEKQTKAFNENTGQHYTEEEFTQKVMTADVKELFKSFDPSDIMTLFSENSSYALHADEILQALVEKEKVALSEMEWSTVVDAFHNWNSTVGEMTDKEIESIVDEFEL